MTQAALERPLHRQSIVENRWERARWEGARWEGARTMTLVGFLQACCLLSVGCGVSTPDPGGRDAKAGDSATSGQPLQAMNSAIARGKWQEAWKLSDAVLAKYPDDAELIALVARVAHENQQPEAAAKLLVDACRAESFQHASRVQQAMIAMIGVGRLYEGMEMLEQAVEKQPLQHDSRRWLYDFYMGTEDRRAGVPHGRFLVRHRQFDLELLLSLSNTERRTQESKPLEEMISRNPGDLRPQLGVAKSKFDQGDHKQATELLQSIVEDHQDYFPAQALLGRSLASSGEFGELEKWSRSQADQVKAFSGYWIALGDWARAKQQTTRAARAYWEATRRDPDVMEAWSKLSATLQQMSVSGADFPDGMLESVDRRVTLLSRFNQLKGRFERTGSISRAIAVDIVTTLRDLGRLWEAEAWAAIASTLPEDDAVAMQQVRGSIVAMLRKETPWQLTEPYREFGLDLTNHDLPAIGIAGTSASPGPKRTETAAEFDPRRLGLLDEAKSRGLNFFGRTGDKLHEPGIMLFRTLGCGGGSIDFDLDGWSDMYLIAAGGVPAKQDSASNALFRNLAGQFSNVTASSQSGDSRFGQGVAVGDVNEDGFPDMLLLNYGPNTLFLNNGDGTFRDATEQLGLNPADWSTSGAIADLDGDGLSDLVIVNYCAGFEPVTRPCPMKDSDVARSCTPMIFASQGDLFLQGSPEGRLLDRTVAWDASPSVLGRGLGVVVGAFDDHPGVDVFVANDITNNHYWSRSLQDGPFRLSESAMPRGLACDDRSLAQGSMGIAVGDFDRDSRTDFYVTNFDKEYNTLHEQSVAGIWQDRTARLQLVEPTLPWVGFGAQAVDLDNDGALELVVSNGHVEIFSRGEERSIYAQPMQIFLRNRSNAYDSVGDSLGGEYLSTPHVGRALWTIDVNRDGLTDLAVTHQTEPVSLLVNQGDGGDAWLEIHLVGRACSRDAIGTTVEVTVGDQSWTAVQTSGDGYLCSNERVLRFGIGSAAGVGEAKNGCRVRVTWPDESQQVYRDVQPGNAWLMVQGDERAFRVE